jgi:hypothetical protein
MRFSASYFNFQYLLFPQSHPVAAYVFFLVFPSDIVAATFLSWAVAVSRTVDCETPLFVVAIKSVIFHSERRQSTENMNDGLEPWNSIQSCPVSKNSKLTGM